MSYENSVANGSGYGVYISGGNVNTSLHNLDIKATFSDDTSNNKHRAALTIRDKSSVNITGKMNIHSSGSEGFAVFVYTGGIMNVEADINIATNGRQGFGFFIYSNATCHINNDSNINIQTLGKDSRGISVEGNSYTDIASAANINIKITGTGGYGIFLQVNGMLDVTGNVKVEAKSTYGMKINSNSGNTVNIGPSAKIYFISGTYPTIFNDYNSGNGNNILDIASSAKIAIEKDGNTKYYEVKENYRDENTSTTSTTQITADNIETTLNVASTSSWQTPADILEQEKAVQAEKEAEEKANREVYQKQFNNALSQYDSLIKDSSYKGVNLLQADDLKVIFNENRSSTLDVSGVDLSSDKIGMMSADWSKAKDVQNSINQIINAKNTLRSASTKLGNYYSIITTREDFTENLINVLEEGADKLTLADMNEESANMLSLQTQQQLAINSLSLASQSSQSILRLF